MRLGTRMRLVWFAMGFLAGWFFFMTYSALMLWPFEDNFLFKWTREAGKDFLRWSAGAVIFAVVIFVVVQLLNAGWLARKGAKKKQ